MNAVDPAISCKRNRPSPMKYQTFPEYLGIANKNVHESTQISLNTPNLWDFLRDMAEILKIYVLGPILLSNPNKYGYK